MLMSSRPTATRFTDAHNAMRNVNQYRFLLTGRETLGFKPRFVLEQGNLRIVPIPFVPVGEMDRGKSRRSGG